MGMGRVDLTLPFTCWTWPCKHTSSAVAPSGRLSSNSSGISLVVSTWQSGGSSSTASCAMTEGLACATESGISRSGISSGLSKSQNPRLMSSSSASISLRDPRRLNTPPSSLLLTLCRLCVCRHTIRRAAD